MYEKYINEVSNAENTEWEIHKINQRKCRLTCNQPKAISLMKRQSALCDDIVDHIECFTTTKGVIHI